MSVALSTLKAVLCGNDGSQGILQDSSLYADIATWINAAVTAIAAGIRMPTGVISPPLPDLLDHDTVSTVTDEAYKALPSDYQRSVIMVADSNGAQLSPPEGGGYYSFGQFMEKAGKKDISGSGSIFMVCVHGKSLYYQNIPDESEDLTVYFYRAPTDMSEDTDTVDGLPDHLASRLIKHWVAKEIFGEGLEDSDESPQYGVKYHTGKFYEAMQDLIDYLETDNLAPDYFGSDDGEW